MPTDIPAGPSAYPTGRADLTFQPRLGTESVVSGVATIGGRHRDL